MLCACCMLNPDMSDTMDHVCWQLRSRLTAAKLTGNYTAEKHLHRGLLTARLTEICLCRCLG